jgi:tetratricopeptide (TPR) repeat protein
VRWLVAALCLAQAPAEVDAARKLERDAAELQRAGRFAEAEKPLVDAVALWTRLRGPDDVEVLADTLSLALAHRRRGDAAGAVPLLQRVVDGAARCRDPEAPRMRRRAVSDLALAQQLSGHPREARATWEGLLRQLGGDELAEDRARVLDNLASLLADTGDLAGAESYARQGYAAWRALRGEGDDMDAAISGSILGRVQTLRGETKEARRLLEEALRVHQDVGGADNPNVSATLNLLGALEAREGHRAAAVADYQRSLGLCRKLGLDPRHRLVVEAENGLKALGAAPDAGR